MATYDLLFDVLHDPTRREIFERVADRPQSVGELAGKVLVSRPAVSQHLRVLGDAGLVVHDKVGTRHIYRATPEGLAPLQAYLERLWNESLRRLKQRAEARPTATATRTPTRKAAAAPAKRSARTARDNEGKGGKR